MEYAKKAKYHDIAEFLGNELRKIREFTKGSNPEEEKKGNYRRKDDLVRDSKQTYKLVFYNEKGEPRDLTEEEVKQLLIDRPELANCMKDPDSIPPEKLSIGDQECW